MFHLYWFQIRTFVGSGEMGLVFDVVGNWDGLCKMTNHTSAKSAELNYILPTVFAI